jgi:flagellin-like protein
MIPDRLVEAFPRDSSGLRNLSFDRDSPGLPDLSLDRSNLTAEDSPPARSGVATDERATSPTIGAVLLVGITVVLATATGAQLFGLAGSQQGAFATATVEFSPGDDRVTVTWLANADADSLTVRILVGDQRRTVRLDGVGDRVVVDGDGVTISKGAVGHWDSPKIADSDEVSVTVIAHKGGENVVVADRSGRV